MINAEYWKDTLLQYAAEKINHIGVLNGTPMPCSDIDGQDYHCNCDLTVDSYSCHGKFLEWLCAEHIEKPKLTKNERNLCEIITYHYMARDMSGKLCLYKEKPHKGGKIWSIEQDFKVISPELFHDCNFPFIKWEDPEPWSVEELLELEVEE